MIQPLAHDDPSTTAADPVDDSLDSTSSLVSTGPIDIVQAALAVLARGEMIVVVDDAVGGDADLVMAAQWATAKKLTFFVNHTSGLICAPLAAERCDTLRLGPMVEHQAERSAAEFTVTVDHRHGTSTGISASDRAITFRALADQATEAEDLARPGHVFPLRARPDGVLERAGRAEAAVDLCRLAGLHPAAVLCQIVEPGGRMARGPVLVEFCRQNGLLMISIDDLIRYRRRTEKLVKKVAEAVLPTRHGRFRCVVYESMIDRQQHVALVMGDPSGRERVLVRVQAECLTGEAFGSLRCDCGQQLEQALGRIAEQGEGVLVFLRDSRDVGVGLVRELRAYEQHDTASRSDGGADPLVDPPAGGRDFGVAAQVLQELGVVSMRLMTNDPAKSVALSGWGSLIVERVPLVVPADADNGPYLRAKRERLGHILDIDTGGSETGAPLA